MPFHLAIIFINKMSQTKLVILGPKISNKQHALYQTIIGQGFCDIQNNQGQGKGYQLEPKAEADNPYFNFDYSGYHKNRI